jgi:putative transport protein
VVNLEVTNPNVAGLTIGRMPGAPNSSVVVSRIMRAGQVTVARAETVLSLGDVLLAVGPKEKVEELEKILGRKAAIDLREVESEISSKRVIVTKKTVLGMSIDELAFPRRFGVKITRLSRMDLEFAASPTLQLKFGDSVLVVGPPEAIQEAARELGNSPKQLNDPQIIPLLVGIALGVLVGSLPLKIPGLPAPVRLGLAGGPLIVAIVLARIGQWKSLVWHMPISANFMIRELGISLFLTCVGLKSGGKFVQTLMTGDGVTWVLWGAAITLIPLLIVAFVGRFFLKTNFTALCGLLAGAMTDPPALAFANTFLGSELPALSYATVYPLTMLLRVLSTQTLVLLLMR